VRNKKYSIVYLMGGFGNQIFQFSFANDLKQKGHKVLIDNSNYKKQNKTEILLREQILPSKYFSFNEPTFLLKFVIKFFDFVRKDNFSNHRLNPLKKFNDKNYEVSKESYLNYYVGYWQNPEKLEKNRDFLIKSLSNDEVLKEYFLKNPIKGSTLVHVRRNDYVKMNEALKIDYFTDAINKAESQIEKFNFDIFTDDYEWVKSQKIFQKANNIFYSSNSKEDTIQTFGKMLVFENFIISNSTYSLVAAILGDKGESYVYYPDPWFRNNIKNLKLKNNWIKLANNG